MKDITREQLKSDAKDIVQGQTIAITFSVIGFYCLLGLAPLALFFISALIPIPGLSLIFIILITLLSFIAFISSVLGIHKYFYNLADTNNREFADFFRPYSESIIRNPLTILLKTLIIGFPVLIIISLTIYANVTLNIILLQTLQSYSTAIYALWFVPYYLLYLMYSQVEFVRAEYPDMGIIESLRESRELMQGNKLAFLLLQFSFIGWFILCMMPLIGLFFSFKLLPYYMTTKALFYINLQGKGAKPSSSKSSSSAVEIIDDFDLDNDYEYKPKTHQTSASRYQSGLEPMYKEKEVTKTKLTATPVAPKVFTPIKAVPKSKNNDFQ